jgi:pilus assembly protein Flp/PilA
MFAKMIAFVRDEDGATAIEYGLIAALVSVAAIGALSALGDSLNSLPAPLVVAERLQPHFGDG